MNNQIQIKITGKNPIFVLKEMLRQKINLYSIEQKKQELMIIINYEDYPKVRKIKTTCKIKIVNRYGLNKYIEIIKKYKYLLISLLVGFLLIYTLSNLIFTIEIIHSNQKLKDLILQDLEEFHIKKYHWKVSKKQQEKIKEAILEKEKDTIEWLEIEERGTKYIINIEQRKKNPEIEKCNDRHIVARKKAIIMEITSTEGEIIKKKNDYVEQGEVMISGLIYNKEKIVSKKCAVGKVYGETWYKVKVTLPVYTYQTKKLNHSSYGLSILFFQNQYEIGNKYQNYQKKEYNIIEGNIIPIQLGLSKYEKITQVKRKHTNKELKEKAFQLATKKLLKQNNKIEQVIAKKVLKNKAFDSKIEVEIFFKVKEDITDYEDITNVNIEEMNREEE